jgi:hypothetical protein
VLVQFNAASHRGQHFGPERQVSLCRSAPQPSDGDAAPGDRRGGQEIRGGGRIRLDAEVRGLIHLRPDVEFRTRAVDPDAEGLHHGDRQVDVRRGHQVRDRDPQAFGGQGSQEAQRAQELA